jgi:class 3 adenylate cyclase
MGGVSATFGLNPRQQAARMTTTENDQHDFHASRIITAMITDIVDSTLLKTMMDAQTQVRRDSAYRSRIKEPHDDRILQHVRAAGGRKVQSTGDGFLFTFGDADEAVLCAVAIQESFRCQPIDTPLGALRIRIGVHTGSALDTGEDFTASVVDKAARVQSEAQAGEVRVSKETRVMVEGLRDVSFEELPERVLRGIGPSTLYRAFASPDAVTTCIATADVAVTHRDVSHMENPYDFATAANHKTFKGRVAEMEELLDSIETGTHTAIFGLQRMGKTSLICQGLAAELESRPELKDSLLIAMIDMQRLGGAQVTYRDFVHAIFESVIEQLARMGLARQVQNLRTLTRGLFTAEQYQRGDRSEFFSVFSKVLAELVKASKRRIVLFIDEFSEIRKVIERNQSVLNKNPSRTSRLLPHDMYIDVPFIHHLSSLLKDETLRGKITFVVLVRPFIAEYDEQQGLQLLKLMNPITLGRLDEVAARKLVTEPLRSYLSFEDDAVGYLIQLTAGHPYLLQFILKLIVDKIKRNGRPSVGVKDIQWVQERMVSDGPAFDAQFAVLISDYSVNEVSHPKEALLGKGMLALVSRLGQNSDGWVATSVILDEFANYDIPEEKTTAILSQLTRTCILEERDMEEQLHYRLAVPLVRERFVRQNLYRKYFQLAKTGPQSAGTQRRQAQSLRAQAAADRFR